MSNLMFFFFLFCYFFGNILANKEQHVDYMIKLRIFRESRSLGWFKFSCGPSVPVELEFGDVCFCGGKKTRKAEVKP